MAKNKKTEDKAGGEIPWMQILISVLLAGILGAQFIIVGHLAGIEERNKDIGDMKSAVDRLVGRFGITEITPNIGGTLTANNVQIEIPPNSVNEPTYFSLDKIPYSNLPAALPDNKYQYSDAMMLSSVGNNVKVNAQVKWDLVAFGANCVEAKILYWNPVNNMWQEVLPQSCTPTGVIGFNAQNGTLYVLTKEK
jgi:hypothetical protein